MLEQEIENLRRRGAYVLTAVLWLHLVLFGVLHVLQGVASPVFMLGSTALFALTATVLSRLCPAAALTRYVIAVALVAMASLLVFAEPGGWQVDMHMYYFAVFAMLTVFCDWKTLLLAAVVTAAHHLSLNFLYPAAVFPDGGSLGRVIVHAAVVVVEVGMLIWFTQSLMVIFTTKTAAIVEAATEKEQAFREEQEHQRAQFQQAEAVKKQEVLAALGQRFESSVKRVVQGVAEYAAQLADTSTSLAHTAQSNRTHVQSASGNLESSQQNVHMLASAAEELSASIGEISQQVQRSAVMANAANTEAGNVGNTAQELAQAARQIVTVVQMIRDITDRINLLALNATIEAARAGEMGRGFAVVAQEVKSLAGQTKKATEEIAAQVSAIQTVTEATVSGVQNISETIAKLSDVAASIASAVEEQSAATQEIARNAASTEKSTRSVAENMHDVEQTTEKTGDSAQKIKHLSEVLAEQSTTLDGEVSVFLRTLHGDA